MSYRFADSLGAGSGRNCPKHVEFYSKNKFEKSVHLVGFIIRVLMYLTFGETLKPQKDAVQLQYENV